MERDLDSTERVGRTLRKKAQRSCLQDSSGLISSKPPHQELEKVNIAEDGQGPGRGRGAVPWEKRSQSKQVSTHLPSHKAPRDWAGLD